MSIPHALLALLNERPNFGLRLQQEFEESTGAIWPLNVGQVYTTLQRLERDGYVALDDDDARGRRAVYQITDSGRGELVEWLHTPPAIDSPPRDELVIKVLVALRVPDVDVHDVIQAHRRRLIESMQRYTQIKANADEEDVELSLVVDAQIFRLEGVVRWLDAADVRLKLSQQGGRV